MGTIYPFPLAERLAERVVIERRSALLISYNCTSRKLSKRKHTQNRKIYHTSYRHLQRECFIDSMNNKIPINTVLRDIALIE